MARELTREELEDNMHFDPFTTLGLDEVSDLGDGDDPQDVLYGLDKIDITAKLSAQESNEPTIDDLTLTS